MRKKCKAVQGWGINDVGYSVTKYKNIDGKKKIVSICPYYKDWKDMLRRCLDLNFQEKHPTYKGCTVCDEWKYLSNFIKWVDSQPNKDWMNCALDKDLLVEGNKHYSPDTCVYICEDLNRFSLDMVSTRDKFMIGAYPIKRQATKYVSQCSNPFTGKRDHLGVFSTELEAHKAWQAKKHEHACRLADLQSDERVAKRLREMYNPDKDLTTI